MEATRCCMEESAADGTAEVVGLVVAISKAANVNMNKGLKWKQNQPASCVEGLMTSRGSSSSSYFNV